MQELILHIDYLLRRHDCVIVPGIGAFIASVRGASISADGLLTPPARILVFNPAVSHNDGLLAASYSRRLRCNADSASRRLATDIDALRQALEAGQDIAIGKRGTLSCTDGNYTFDATDEASWLPTLQLQSILEMARYDENAAAARAAAIRGQRIASYLRRLKIAASIAVILALGFIVSTPTPIDNAQVASPVVEQFKPKAPQSESLIRRPGQQSEVLLIAASTDTTAVLTADTAAIAAYKSEYRRRAEELRAEAARPARPVDSGRYCLVVASLNNGEEANRFLAANPSMQLHVLEKDGRYRIFAISGQSIAEVKDRADAEGLTSRFPGAWVCRK